MAVTRPKLEGNNILQSTVEFDNKELNMGLMFTNKALQIMTPIYKLMKTTTPLKSNTPQEGFFNSQRVGKIWAMKKGGNQQFPNQLLSRS